MPKTPFHVLYEDNHLLVVDKPAGLPTMGVEADRDSLVTAAKAYLKQKYKKPGKVYIGVVSRLDAPASGVLVLARTSKAARRLNEQFAGREVEKVYLALVEGLVEPPRGACRQRVARDDSARRMQIVQGEDQGQTASLRYERMGVFQGNSLLRIELETGRKHQIRLQLADRGHPILGDRKYGGTRRFPAGIALHAWRLTLEHPVLGQRIAFEAPLPRPWRQLGVDL